MYRFGVFPMAGVLLITVAILLPFAGAAYFLCAMGAAVCDAFPGSAGADLLSILATKVGLEREPTIWATAANLRLMLRTEAAAMFTVALHLISVFIMPIIFGASDMESFGILLRLHPAAMH
jgi:hypothetical protein